MLITTAIGAAAALGSAAYGAIKSSQANKAANKAIQDERDENKRWYQYRMNEDYSSRSDAQAIISKQRDLLQEQYRNARATNAVAGGSDAASVAAKQAANESVSNTMSQIAADASSHKDSIEQQYRAKDSQLNQQQVAVKQQQAQNIATAAGQAVNAGLGLIGAGINAQTAPQQATAPVNPGQVKLQNDIASNATAPQQAGLNGTIKANAIQQMQNAGQLYDENGNPIIAKRGN